LPLGNRTLFVAGCWGSLRCWLNCFLPMPRELMPLVFELGIFGVVAFLLWLLVHRKLKKFRESRRKPFTRTLFRSPGEGCLEKIEQISDEYWEHFVAIFLAAAILVGAAMGLFLPELKGPLPASITGIAFLAWIIYKARAAEKAIRNLDHYRLGLEGERQTAQALQPLLGEGYELFHDLEFKGADGKAFNIDHVLLGPNGVVAIETKARSKEADGKGSEAATARYDGKRVAFPKGDETRCLEQALANARFLSRELTGYTGEKVFVRAAVSIPGWLVIQTASEVNPFVGNPEVLRGWARNAGPAVLGQAQRNRIRSFLAKTAEVGGQGK